jgi:hypothetical protein
MSNQDDFGSEVSPSERARLAAVADRLERDRPVPRAAFRGDLRRLLVKGGDRARRAARANRWRVLVATYSGLGALLLAVAAIGLAGAGPFGA